MHISKKSFVIATIAIIGIIATVFSVNSVFAKGVGGSNSKEALMNRVYMSILYDCYVTDKEVKYRIETWKESLTDELLGERKLPNGFFGVDDDSRTCNEIIGMMYPAYGGRLNNSNRATILKSLGYEEETSSDISGRKCVTFNFSLLGNRGTTDGTVKTPEVCGRLNSDGQLDISGDMLKIYHDNDSNDIFYETNGGTNYCHVTFGLAEKSPDGTPAETDVVTFNACSGTWDDAVKQAENNIQIREIQSRDLNNNIIYKDTTNVSETSGGASNGTGVFVFDDNNREEVYKVALKTIINTTGNMVFTDAQVVALYQSYLNSYADTICTDDQSRVDILTSPGTPGSNNTGYQKVRLVNVQGDGKVHDNCYTKAKPDAPSTFYGVLDSNIWDAKGKKPYYFNQIVEKLNSLNISPTTGVIPAAAAVDPGNGEPDILPDGTTTGDDADGDAGTAERTEEQVCYDGGGALGWVMCPTLKAVGGIVESLYKFIEQHYLKISPGAVFEQKGVEDAWGIVRNLANIVFVILFMVVIISQLTGVGIDNYGIKKILPKLIITALLVNLSYIICMLIVDLSNVLGVGIREFLVSNAPNDAIQTSVGSDVAGGIAIAAAGIGIVVMLAFINPGIILALILAALGVVLSLVVLWICLLARQVLVYILVIFSPVAFVCYLLPNTEKVFKKWVDVAKGVFLLYPICSLAIGAGIFTSSVVASAAQNIDNESGQADTFLVISAMVVQVIPYFFIPSLIRNALAATNNLGAKISSFGQKFSGGVKRGTGNAIRNSRLYRNAQDRVDERRAAKDFGRKVRLAQKTQDSLEKRRSSGKALSIAQRKRLLDAKAVTGAARSTTDTTAFNARMTNQDLEMKNKEIADIQALNDSNTDMDLVSPSGVYNALSSANTENEFLAAMRSAARTTDGLDGIAGALDSGAITGEKSKWLRDEMMRDGVYKQKLRPAFDAVKKALPAEGGGYDFKPDMVSNAMSGSIKSMKADNFVQSTDTVKEQIIVAARAGNADAQRVIHEALTTTAARGQLKASEINSMQGALEASGFTAPGTTIALSNDGSAAPVQTTRIDIDQSAPTSSQTVVSDSPDTSNGSPQTAAPVQPVVHVSPNTPETTIPADQASPNNQPRININQPTLTNHSPNPSPSESSGRPASDNGSASDSQTPAGQQPESPTSPPPSPNP